MGKGPILLASCAVFATAAQAQAKWPVDAKPVVDIAGTSPSGDVVLATPVGATRLANGTIVVGDRGASAVRFFDATGKLTRSVGQPGQGPGDFRMILWVGQCASDSVFAWDYGLRRMSVLSAQGVLVRQFAVPSDSGTRVMPPTAVSCSRSGVFAFQAPSAPRPGAFVVITPDSSVIRNKSAISLGDRQGHVSATLGEIWFGEMVMLGRGGGPRGGGFRPLGRTTSLAVSADRVYVGTADSAFVDVYTIDGQKMAALPLGLGTRRPTRGNLDAAAEQSAGMAPSAMRQSIKEQMMAVPMPENLPSYSSLLVDSENLLWVNASAPGDSETHLRAVQPNGSVRADVTIPLSLTVYEIGRDYILGSYEDKDGEPHVVMYRLRRG